MSKYEVDRLVNKIQEDRPNNNLGIALGLAAVASAIVYLAEVLDRKHL